MTYHYGCAHIFIIEDKSEYHGFWVSYLKHNLYCNNCRQKKPLYNKLEDIKAFLLAQKEKEKEVVWQTNTVTPESIIDYDFDALDVDGFE